MSLNNQRHFVHKRIKISYPSNPVQGHEKYRYRCPFCQFMVHANRFQELFLPVVDADILIYGGYRGIKALKPILSSEMRLKVLEAMQEKIEWIYDKIGGELLWLRSKNVSIRDVQNISYSKMGVPSRPLGINVSTKSGLIQITKSGSK